MRPLEGKVAIVTGSGRGIGREIARELATQGAKVVVNYVHSEAGAKQLLSEFQDNQLEGIAVQANITELAEIHQLISKTLETYGRIDILVNNAAVDPTEDFMNVSESFWENVVHTNLKGTFFCSQACAKEMIKTGTGRIINISSVHGQATMSNYAVYASTKGGINALTRQLVIDLAKHNITVNAVAPGAVEVEKFIGQPWYNAEQIGSFIPMGRIGKPSDIAPMVAFLASDKASFITGQVLTIDGGSTAKLYLPIDVL